MLETIRKSGMVKYLITIFTGMFLKLFALHYNMGIEDIFKVTVKNLFIVMAIMCITCLFSKKNRVRAMLIAYFIISVLLFIDTAYYNHFYTIIRAHSIYQIGQVRHVSNSIYAVMKPLYFLYFIDSVLIFFYLRKDKYVALQSSNRQKKGILISLLALILMVTGMNASLSNKTMGYFTPHNSGVINYHLYDLAGYIKKATLNTDYVYALSKNIDKKQGNVKYFGMAEGKNVFVIQAESVQNFVINLKINGEEITPVLNELIGNDSIYFNRFYEQVGWGNTSDAEFISHNGFYSSNRVFSYKAYEDSEFVTLPILLKNKGYDTIAFHGNYREFWSRDKAYPNQGLDRYVSLEDFEVDEFINLGLSDGSFFRQSMGFLKELPQPFYSFFVTVTSHHPFNLPDEHKHLDLGSKYEDTVLDGYLQTVHYLDKEIGNFIERLKEEGLYENSIIAIYGDHKGLDMRNEEANELISSLIGKEYREDEMHRVPFIIHMPGEGVKKEIDTVGGQIDFFPTMANLLGIKMDRGSTFGKDLLNVEKGFVALQSHVAMGSFIDDEKVFVMSKDGLFENSTVWDINTGIELDVEVAREGYERVFAEIHLSDYILRNDLVRLVHEKGIKEVLNDIE